MFALQKPVPWELYVDMEKTAIKEQAVSVLRLAVARKAAPLLPATLYSHFMLFCWWESVE